MPHERGFTESLRLHGPWNISLKKDNFLLQIKIYENLVALKRWVKEL